MGKYSLSIVCLLICAVVGAQKKDTYYTVQPGERMQDIIPQKDMYEYPQFEQGYVYFKSGVRSTAKMNYNFIYEEIVFITAGKDTMAIENPEDVKEVVIGKQHYYFSSIRFVKLDTAVGDVKLATSGFFSVINRRKEGAYGTTTDGGSDSYGYFIVPNNTKLDLIPRVALTVVKREAIFIGNKFNQFVSVTKKNIFSFYPEKEAQLKKYFQDKEVNFSSREDIIALISHMGKL